MNYEKWMAEYFTHICAKHKLSIGKVDQRTYALVGTCFLLVFTIDIDDVVVSYVREDEKGHLREWYIDAYICQEIIVADRKGITHADTLGETKKNILLILSRVFERRFDNLLSGGVAWMPEYLNSGKAGVSRIPSPKLQNFFVQNSNKTEE